MTFDADVGGVTCSVTLDTGSSINIIHKSVFDVLPKAPPLFTTATVAHTVSRDPLPLIGRTQIAVKVAGEVVVVPFYVSDQIDCTVLLGLEFFGVCPCVLDLTKSQLILSSAKMVRTISASVFSVGKVICQRDIAVPAGHEVFFPGFVPNVDFRGPALCEPLLEVPGLELVPSMVQVNGQSVPCIVRNITTEPVTIPKRAEIGRLEVGVAEFPVPSGDADPNWREKIDLSDTDLSKEQKEKVTELLTKYSDMFDGRLGFTSAVEHHIDTGDSPPIRSAPHRVPPFLEDKVRAEIQRLVDLGVLEESNGYWSSPACFVAKKDGRVRICADLRKVNAVTKMPAYPVPRIDTILDSLGGNSMFCVLDLRMCYFQIGVREEDRPKTTIVTPFGAWQHLRLPMGLNGAAASCARMLDIVLRDLPKGTCHSYFDDVCLGGKTFEETLEKLELVLDRLHRAGLTINLEKCSLFRSSVKFLGHVVDESGLSLDPDRVSKVRDWPIPRTAKQLSSFLGLAGYMRKFVKNFASISAPLFKLLQKDVKFQWSEEAQFSFDRLRKALSEAPVALENSNRSHQKNKEIYDRKLNENSYLPGDKVYLHKGIVPRGQYYKFLRPWKRAVVVDQVGPLNYRIRLEGARSTLIVHHNRLKPRVDTGEGESPVTAPTASVSRADPAARPQPAVGTAAGVTFPTGRRRMDGVSDNQRVSGAQCEGRPSCQPADAASLDDSGPPALSLLNPFAISFAPQTLPVQTETARETRETPEGVAEPIAGSAPTGAAEVPPDVANTQVTADMRSPELRRSTRVVIPPDRYSP
ncbi:uncharacterized protein LOC122373168 [Amphibalanus amphitrite]|uniref:uncharacterized protein LOC122373168 n=1 Tax=Amphibalanus amphitrite TaxID=1232801 RepID=UPI001C924CD6|nr:uncharacterized protein LOC122373168 [Amphibalanus amphitrite]